MSEDSLVPSPAQLETTQLARLVGLFVGLGLACAYGFTLAPTIWAGDAGELVTAAYGLGVPHAPGYPTFTLLGYLATHLPIGPDPAWRLNAFSALCAWGAAMVVYLLLIRRGHQPLFAGLAALGLGVGPTLWANAVVAEVYSLNLLLLALFLLFLDADLREGRTLRRTWIVAGLTITAHQTSLVLVIVALAVYGKKQTGLLKVALPALLLGLVPYTYTYLAAQGQPLLNWGDIDSLAEWLRFTLLPVGQQVNEGATIDHLHYAGQLLFGPLWGSLFGSTGHPGEMGLVPFLLALIGLVVSLMTNADDDRAPVVWSWALLGYLALFWLFLRPSTTSLEKLDPYYLPVWLLGWLLVPQGYHLVLAGLEHSAKLHRFRDLLRPLLGTAVMLTVVVQAAGSATRNNRAGDTLVSDSYTALLQGAPRDAVLLCNWDDLFPLLYLQRVAKLRPDVVPVLAYFPDAKTSEFWSGWYFAQLERAHPELALWGTEGTPQERLSDYLLALVELERPALLTFYDPGGPGRRLSAPLFGEFDFSALPFEWEPHVLAVQAYPVETLPPGWRPEGRERIAEWYLKGEHGVETYRALNTDYSDSYDQGYLTTRYLIGMTHLGWWLATDSPQLALDLFDRAFAVQPYAIEFYGPAIAFAAAQDDYAKALAWQSAFVRALPEVMDITAPEGKGYYLTELTDYAQLLAQAEEPEQARSLIEQVLRQDPANTRARMLLQELSGTGDTQQTDG